MRRSPRALGWAVALATARALAQPSAPSEADRITRRQLVNEAIGAQREGRFQGALDLVLRAQQIEPTAGTRLLVAQLREQLGQHVEAASSAELCLREVERDVQTTPQNRQAIRAQCEQTLAEARVGIGNLVVEVPADAPPAAGVSVNGEELRPALYGIARPTNVGPVTVTARLGGATRWERVVTVAPGRTETVRVELPRTEAPPPGSPLAPPRVPRVADPGRSRRIAGLATGGAGLALVAGAAVAGAVFQSVSGDYERRRCEFIRAEPDCEGLYGRLEVLNGLQWGGYLVGGTLAVTGVVLFFTAPRAPRAERAFNCGVGPGAVGVSCETRF